MNSSLLLRYQSHMDFRYKIALTRTIFKRAYYLSSSWEYFSKECARLKDLFFKLKYPTHPVDSINSQFLTKVTNTTESKNHTNSRLNSTRIVLLFKEQNSTDTVRKRLRDFEQYNWKNYTASIHEQKLN